MDKISDIIGSILAVAGIIVLVLFVLGLVLGISFLLFAGLVALWIQLFGSPESFWAIVLCGWVVHVILALLFHDTKIKA